MGRAQLRGDVEIPAHPHRQDGEGVAGGDLGEQCEMRRRRIVRGRNAHQSLNGEAIVFPALSDEGVGFLRQDARLLRFGARVHLNEKARAPALPRRFLGERLCNFRTVNGFDDIEQRDRLGGLVRLQGTDQAQFEVRIGRPQRRPFRLRLLNAILAEEALTGCERLFQPRLALGFRDGDDLDRTRAACFLQRGVEPCANRGKVRRKSGGRRRIGVSVHEGLRTRALRLAAAAAALKRAGGVSTAPFSLAFLTDRRRIANPEPILRALPAGAAVIYRDYDDPKRTVIASRYAALCRARNLVFLVAGDAGLAHLVKADGVHVPAGMLKELKAAKAGRGADRPAPRLLTAACHDAAELRLAAAIGADIALLSPAFATGSHPGADELGAVRFKALAASAAIPVLALGGVDDRNARLLAGAKVAGIAAIGAFLPQGVAGVR